MFLALVDDVLPNLDKKDEPQDWFEAAKSSLIDMLRRQVATDTGELFKPL